MSDESKDRFTPVSVVLHCAATPDYPYGNKAFDLIGAADIDSWHRSRGFDCIGYHYVIRQSGMIEDGRPTDRMGAHTKGYNSDTLGICVVGNGRINREQLLALSELYKEFTFDYGITWQEWYGHYEFTDKKTCPNMPMELVRSYFRLL